MRESLFLLFLALGLTACNTNDSSAEDSSLETNDTQTSAEPRQNAAPLDSSRTPGVLHENLSFVHDGLERRYHFYEAGGDEGDPRPLIVVLHGGGADIDSFIGKNGGAAPLAGAWLTLAEEEDLHILIPQALAFDKGPNWNDCRSDCVHCGDYDDVGFILSLIEELAEIYNIDASKKFVCGESNGGLMSLRFAQERPEVFKGYGPIIALMPANNECEAPAGAASVAFILGTEDKAIPYEGGPSVWEPTGSFLSAEDSLGLWLERNQCASSESQVHEFEDGPEDDGSTVTSSHYLCPATDKQLKLYRVDGGGHVTPSIEGPVSAMWELLVGKQNEDIESARELWSFFKSLED